jgi:hypothetical protein
LHVDEYGQRSFFEDARVDDAAHATWDPFSSALSQEMMARHITIVPTLTLAEDCGPAASSWADLRRFSCCRRS